MFLNARNLKLRSNNQNVNPVTPENQSEHSIALHALCIRSCVQNIFVGTVSGNMICPLQHSKVTESSDQKKPIF